MNEKELKLENERLKLENEYLKNQILTSLQNIENILKKTNDNCDKMGNHIDFVEGIYTKVKIPFNYAIDKINTYQQLINE